jgi:hypothetical protein
MSDAEHTPSTTTGDGHGHDADTEHGHGHGPAAEALGPVDLATWAYAIAGSALGALTIIALIVAGGG